MYIRHHNVHLLKHSWRYDQVMTVVAEWLSYQKKVSRPIGLLFLCGCYRTEFSIDLLQIHTKYSLDSGLLAFFEDPNTFLSLICTRKPRPKGHKWNITDATDVVVVVWGYTIDSSTIKHCFF